MNERVGNRKTRSDKKTDLRATMSSPSRKRLYIFAALSDEPIKDVAERLVVLAAASPSIVESISIWFRRNYFYGSGTVAIGDSNRPKLKVKSTGTTETVSIKFTRRNYDVLCAIAYALDVTPSSAASVLIVTAMNNRAFMRDYVTTYLSHLDAYHLSKVKQLLNL